MSKLSIAVANLETRPNTKVYDNHTRKDYRLPDNSRLNAYVDNVVHTGMKGIILPGELTSLSERVDANKVMKALPAGLSEDDFLSVSFRQIF